MPDSVHVAADLVAYSHLLLPWAGLSQATQAAAAAAEVTELQLPQLKPCSAKVPEQQVGCLWLVLMVEPHWSSTEGCMSMLTQVENLTMF